MNQMLSYRRNTGNRLDLLRIFFILGTLAAIYFFNKGSNVVYLVAVIVLAGLPITITEVFIENHECEIRKYYFFGFIPAKRTFYRDKVVKVVPYEVEYQDIYGSESTESWLDIFLVFVSAPKLIMQRCKIEYIDKEDKLETIRVDLTNEELKLIQPVESEAFPDKPSDA